MSRARSDIRKVVNGTRTPTPPPNGNGDGAETQENGEDRRDDSTPIPEPPLESDADSPKAPDIVSKQQRNVQQVLEFVSRLTSAAVRTPMATLDDHLDDLGFQKATAEDDESDSIGSSSSFSFNFSDSSSMTSVSSPGFGSRNLRNSLARFSSDLAHRCWVENHREIAGQQTAVYLSKKARKEREEENAQAVVSWRANAAVMFIDLSGYSKIASYLTSKGGAHALSEAVNAYFEAILTVVVDQYRGDIITFAGDAIVACWPVTKYRKDNDSALLACACALDLQRKCGMSPVRGTDLSFRLHIGITFGEIESQILICRSAHVMQGAYHFVCGPPLTQTATVVDAAKVGEVCITKDVKTIGGVYLQCDALSDSQRPNGTNGENAAGGKRVSDPPIPSRAETAVFRLVNLDDDYQEYLGQQRVQEPPVQRSPWIEANLVPPSVARKLRQGFKPAHLAEMRFLCVMFVRKQLETVNTEEWFAEVQQIMDEARCPVVQLLHDDKGTHLIAAVNLYRTERGPADIGIGVSRRLMERETGCAIGVACGEVFCGITGSDQSCRWDVTGPSVVRACRLMQHAAAEGKFVLFDESVYANTDDVSQLEHIVAAVTVKGSPKAIDVYTLSEVSVSVTAGIVSLGWGSPSLHREKREKLLQFLQQEGLQRGCVLVSGPVGCGKKTLVALAVESAARGSTAFTFMMHFASRDVRQLAALATLFQWFANHVDEELRGLAATAHTYLTQGKLTQTLRFAHELVDAIVRKGIRCCFVIAYAHFLDSASLRFIKAVATATPAEGTTSGGRFIIVLTAYELYGALSVGDLATDLQRALAENQRLTEQGTAAQTELLQIRVQYPTDVKEFADGVHGTTYFHLRDKAAAVLHEATGGCLSLIPPFYKAMRARDAELQATFSGEELKDKQWLPLAADGTHHLSAEGEDYLLTEIYWPQVAPSATARFAELYDELPPRLQLVARVVASLSTTTGSANRFHVFRVMEKLNSKVTEERVFADVAHLLQLDILKNTDVDGGEVMFKVPAMVDVIVGLFTPDQDRMLKRHAFNLAYSYYSTSGERDTEAEYLPIFTSFIARLARAAGSIDVYQALIGKSWARTLEAAKDFPAVKQRMEERLMTEHRRFPEHCPESLFEIYSPKPLLSRVWTREMNELEQAAPMPVLGRDATDFYPPMALGAISGELQKVYWAAANNWLDLTKDPNRHFIDPVARSYLKIDLDAFCAALSKFETNIPRLANPTIRPDPYNCTIFASLNPETMTVDEERKILAEIQETPKTTDAALHKLALLRAYYLKMHLPRCDRMVEFAHRVTSAEQMCGCMREAAGPQDCVHRAYMRLVRPYPISNQTIHEAILDLATAGWVSRYFTINLQGIRDQVLRQRTATVDDFKALLVSLKMFGEELTAATKPM